MGKRTLLNLLAKCKNQVIIDIYQDLLDFCIFISYNIYCGCNYKRNGGNNIMAISYNKLWKLMIDQDLNKTQLKDKAQISTNAVAKLGKNEAVSMETLEKICRTLNCDVGDIMEFIDDNNKAGRK